MSEAIHGGCPCGAITFSGPTTPRWVAHCHCTQCQKSHGAAYVTWVGVLEREVTWEDPGALLRWFASSAEARRGFCGRCGARLFFKSSRWPGELHLVRASFDSEFNPLPTVHAYYDTHVTWADLHPILPQKSAAGVLL